jgi:hypothetical protein
MGSALCGRPFDLSNPQQLAFLTLIIRVSRNQVRDLWTLCILWLEWALQRCQRYQDASRQDASYAQYYICIESDAAAACCLLKHPKCPSLQLKVTLGLSRSIAFFCNSLMHSTRVTV